MKYAPHNYQQFAQDFIIEKPACGLLLDMGLGKTAITLTAINELMFDYFEITRVLVIAPLRVAEDTWDKEIAKWDHLRHLKLSKVIGTEQQRRVALDRKAHIYIINRENVPWLIRWMKENRRKWLFDMLVIDELSSFKSPKAIRFKALKSVRHKIKRVVGLTGTPAPNGLIDLWAQVFLLDGGERLGRFVTNYRDEYFTPDRQNGAIVFNYKLKDGAEDRIYEKIGDICMSMKAVDFLDMPERVEHFVEVHMDKAEATQYEQLARDMFLPFEGGAEIDAVNAAVLSGKLLQMANGAVYDDDGVAQTLHDRKLDALEDIIEAANGKPVLVFYNFKHDRARIAKRFKVREIKSSDDITAWNAGEIEVAIAHPANFSIKYSNVSCCNPDIITLS